MTKAEELQILRDERDGFRSAWAKADSRLMDAEKEIERLRTIETAANNLIAQKGRHSTQIACKRLEEALKTANT